MLLPHLHQQVDLLQNQVAALVPDPQTTIAELALVIASATATGGVAMTSRALLATDGTNVGTTSSTLPLLAGVHCERVRHLRSSAFLFLTSNDTDDISEDLRQLTNLLLRRTTILMNRKKTIRKLALCSFHSLLRALLPVTWATSLKTSLEKEPSWMLALSLTGFLGGPRGTSKYPLLLSLLIPV